MNSQTTQVTGAPHVAIYKALHPRWFCTTATGKHTCCDGATLLGRTDVGIFWDTPFVIIEKDGTERPATALEETWIERFKKHHKRDKSTKFKKIGGILNEYRCAACNEEV